MWIPLAFSLNSSFMCSQDGFVQPVKLFESDFGRERSLSLRQSNTMGCCQSVWYVSEWLTAEHGYIIQTPGRNKTQSGVDSFGGFEACLTSDTGRCRGVRWVSEPAARCCFKARNRLNMENIEKSIKPTRLEVRLDLSVCVCVCDNGDSVLISCSSAWALYYPLSR